MRLERAMLALGLGLCLSHPVLAQTAPAANAPARPAGPPPAPQGWTMTVGVAPVFGMAWAGSKDTALSIFPGLRVNYKDTLFLSVQDGLGWNAVNRDGWKAGPIVRSRFGRNEDDGGSPFLVAGGSDALRGMGDIGIAGEGGGFVEKRLGAKRQWRLRAEVRQGFGAHEGVVGDVLAQYSGRSGRLMYAVGPRATFASGDFMRTYYGVDAGQSARTGLAVSRPDGGLASYGLGANLIRPLDRKRAVAVFAGVDRLGGEPAGSSLIRERGQRTQFSIGLGYSYRFGL
ncbi:MipA/OmpV family protein [Novosphingobium sp. 1Y9A]|uniref:MipA/OmpV family protein n=2 Tax=Novosphingobium jiangmenense TaxID=2791981 RepID=A0ABS0HEG8_9SPHN|nr:MipA/OmpV family protein [Novosphingobium jiangmenense]